MSAFTDGLLAGYGIAIPMGAIGILIVGMGVRCGFRIGFLAGAGAATADLLYAVLASAAGAVLTTLLAPVAPLVRIGGGLVLVGLAIGGLRDSAHPSSQTNEAAEVCGAGRMYTQFLGLTMISPLTVIYFSACILGRNTGPAQISLVPQLLFVAGVGLASLSWPTLLAALGGFARSRLSARFQLSAMVFGNLLVLVFGLRILATSILKGV